MADQITVDEGTSAVLPSIGPGDVPDPGIPYVPNPFTNEHLQSGFYDDFFIDTIYRNDSGLRVIAKASSSASAKASSSASAQILNSVVRIHRGTSTKEIHWNTQRRNAKPLIPKFTTNDPNEIPISQTMNLTNMAEGGGAGTIWRAQGVYIFALLQPKNDQSRYPVGSSPAEIAPSSARWYGPEDFSQTIIDGQFASPGDPRVGG